MEEPVGTIIFAPGEPICIVVRPGETRELDGGLLPRSYYPELYDVIGQSYGGVGEEFRLPDLRPT